VGALTIQASSIRQRLANPSSSRNPWRRQHVVRPHLHARIIFQWEDEQGRTPACSSDRRLAQYRSRRTRRLRRGQRRRAEKSQTDGGGDRAKGQRRGQRRRLTIVYSFVVVAVMDYNQKSGCHRREIVRLEAEMGNGRAMERR
jgi:hypothetical protein